VTVTTVTAMRRVLEFQVEFYGLETGPGSEAARDSDASDSAMIPDSAGA
jgi:hypothetical protein